MGFAGTGKYVIEVPLVDVACALVTSVSLPVVWLIWKTVISAQ